MRTKLLSLACLLLTSCATTYGPVSGITTWGFKDKQIEPGVYQISFAATEATQPGDVDAYWHQRARELCGHDHYKYEMEHSIHHYTDSGYHHLSHDDHGVAYCNVPRPAPISSLPPAGS